MFGGDTQGSQHPSPPVPGAAAHRCIVAAIFSERNFARCWVARFPQCPSPGPPAPPCGHPLPYSQVASSLDCPSEPAILSAHRAAVLGEAGRDLHADWHLLENCPGVPKMGQPPPTHPLHFPPPLLEPSVPGRHAPTPAGRTGAPSSQSKTQTGPRDTKPVSRCGRPCGRPGLRSPSPACRTGVGRAGPGPPPSPLTAHAGPGHNLDTSLTTSEFLLSMECSAISVE